MTAAPPKVRCQVFGAEHPFDTPRAVVPVVEVIDPDLFFARFTRILRPFFEERGLTEFTGRITDADSITEITL